MLQWQFTDEASARVIDTSRQQVAIEGARLRLDRLPAVADMPTGIEDLPFELLERILSFAVDDYHPDLPKALTSRNAFLKDAALISRQFRCPSQAALWSVVRVHSVGTAKKLLSSPVLGMYGTRHLDLAGVHSGMEGLSGSVAARVLAKVRGVQILRLADFGRLSARVLQSDSLSGAVLLIRRTCERRRADDTRDAGLRILDLMTAFPDKPSVLVALNVPFHLRELRLYNRSYGTTILPVLFHTCAHSLISLTVLTGPGSPSYSSLLEAFPVVAPNLIHFGLQHRPTPALLELLRHLTRLTTLECHFAVDLAATLDALPSKPSLRTLVIELDFNLQQAASILLARLGQPVLADLRMIRIPRAPDKQEVRLSGTQGRTRNTDLALSFFKFREFGGQELLERCQERNISVEIGQTVAWRTRLFQDE